MKVKTLKRLLDLHRLMDGLRIQRGATQFTLKDGLVNPKYERLQKILNRVDRKIRDTLAGELALAEYREEQQNER